MNNRIVLIAALLPAFCLAAVPPSPLAEAARANNTDTVKRLLQASGVNVNAAIADGTTALHWAVQKDNLPMATELVGAAADVKLANRYGVAPLSLAAEKGNAAMLELLLKAGADPNTTMPEGETALMTAARGGKADAVKTLLVHGANVNARDQFRGETALMWAAGRNNADAIRILVEFGGDIRLRTSSQPRPGQTPGGFTFGAPGVTSFSALLFAVRGGHSDAARALLESGADVNDVLSNGESALIVAIANGHWQLADYLLGKGADPNHSRPGWTPLHQLMRSRRLNVGFGFPPPIQTGTLDSIDLLKKLLAKGAGVNARMTKDAMKDGQRTRLNRLGATPFLLAAKNTDVEAMRILLAAGADPSIPTADNDTPLMAAAGVHIWNPGEDGGSLAVQEDEQLEAVKLCVQLGNDVNAANVFGDTPLHGAAYRGANSMIEFLLRSGAKLDARDSRGWTPLTVANGIKFDCFYKAQPETAALLERYMKQAGLATSDQIADGTECLDCLGTHPELVRARNERIRKLEAEFAKQEADRVKEKL